MCQKNCTTANKKGQHLVYEERLVIEHLYNKQKKNAGEIAEELGRHRTTLSREIKRGIVELLNSDYSTRLEYSAEIGQNVKETNGTVKGPNLKIANDHKLSEFIEEKIRDKYSPEVISKLILEEESFKIKIHWKTIYNYIDKGVLLVERSDLVHGTYKSRKKERKVDSLSRRKLKEGRMISDRPEAIESREELGHWEMDLVEGKKQDGGSVLLVLSERCSRKEIIELLPDKTQNSVIKALDKIERRTGVIEFRKVFKTITTDNGSEFLNYEGIEKSYTGSKIQRTKQYFANAYCSWQRGTNENINKMIRRFLPKGTSFRDVTKSMVKKIEEWINNYPRKMFNFKSANEIYNEKMGLSH